MNSFEWDVPARSTEVNSFASPVAPEPPGLKGRWSDFSQRWLVPSRVWMFAFGLWALFLSGLLTPWLGTPGIRQALQLKGLLSQRVEHQERISSEIQALYREQERLETSSLAIEQEIRKVLGYAASGELIFDFSNVAEGSESDPSEAYE